MKYEFNGDTKVLPDGVVLRRIRALHVISGTAKIGDLGGWIESEYNLSQDNNCWVGGEGRVSGNACVSENARVLDRGSMSGNASLSGNAVVSGNGTMLDNANVCDNASIFGNACMSGNSIARGNADIFENAKVSGNAIIEGWVDVFGNAVVSCDAILSNSEDIFGNSIITETNQQGTYKWITGALEALWEGEKITRAVWECKKWLVWNDTGEATLHPFISIHYVCDGNEESLSWDPSQEDILAEDWYILS